MSDPEPRKLVETTRPHFSFTQLSMFLRCSMQYYFRYVLGLKERPSLNLTRGSAGHSALENNARFKIEHKTDRPVDEILDIFVTDYDRRLTEFDKSDFEPGDNPDKDKDLTVETLRYFRLNPALAEATTPKAVELDFTIPIPPTEDGFEIKPVTGKIDIVGEKRRVMVPRARPVVRTEVVDYKFPARKPSNVQDLADLSDQITLYDYVLTTAGVPTADVGFMHFIPPTKTIGPRVEATYRSAAQMTPERRASRHQRLIYKFRQAARQIMAGIFIPTDDPKTCSWCGFRTICQDSLVKDDYEAIRIRGRHQ